MLSVVSSPSGERQMTDMEMIFMREEFVMPPDPKAWEQAASVICGHAFVQQWLPDEQAEFESFVREVLRDFGGRVGTVGEP